MERHKINTVLPTMNHQAYQFLRQKIETEGLLEPITIYEGKILDGWHRYQACENAGIKPNFKKYKGDDPVGYVFAKHVARRHLTESQLILTAMEISHCYDEGAGHQ